MKKNALLLVLFFVSQVSFSQESPTVYFEQGFEDNAYFNNLSVNGYTVNTDSANGYWGTIKADANGDFAVCISDKVAHSGQNSIKVTRMATTNYFASCIFKNALPVSGFCIFEVWVYRPADSEFSCVLSGVDASSKKVDLASVHTAETGRFFIRNNSMVNNRTYVPMPTDTWMLIKLELDWESNTIVFSYEKDGARTELGELELIGGGATKIDRFYFGATPSPAGSATYFDDVKISYSDVKVEPVKKKEKVRRKR